MRLRVKEGGMEPGRELITVEMPIWRGLGGGGWSASQPEEKGRKAR